MKNSLLFTILFAFTLASCGNSKKSFYSNNFTEIKLPFSGSEYKTDKTYFRVVSQGTSPDISMAEKIAMSNARSKMAFQIQTLVKSVTRNYSEQIKDGNSFSGGETFEALSEDVAKQIIPNISVKDNKVLKSETNIYEHWVCIEVLRKDIQNRAAQELSSKKSMKIESNREEFQKIFDQEMDKISQ
jgi:hypothetical protein